MYRIVFVVLHYMALEETKECINSILSNVDYKQYKIVVVDNNSSNQSGIELQKMYASNDNVKVILNSNNLGFAKGNNVGYSYAKNELDAEFIITINNDTIIDQKNFIELLINIFNENNYYVLGPDIIGVNDKYHQNPLDARGVNLEEVKKLLTSMTIQYYKFMFLGLTHTFGVIKKLRNLLSRKETTHILYSYANENYKIPQNDVKLHGACLVLSPLYVKHFDYAFLPLTYMYMEEDILYYICKKNNFKMLYDPKVYIYHKENASTDILNKSTINKKIFYWRNIRDSTRILYKIMKDN